MSLRPCNTLLRRFGFGAVLALLLGAPAAWSQTADQVPEKAAYEYAPPTREPRGAVRRKIALDPDAALQTLWVELEEAGLAIEVVDPEARLIVARYSGEPQRFIDCGKVTFATGAQEPRQYSANKAQVRTYRLVGGVKVGLVRLLRLDARLTARIEPADGGAVVMMDALYVVTKTLRRAYKGGVAGELLGRELASFRSATSGSFTKGTRCVATGRLERTGLESLVRGEG